MTASSDSTTSAPKCLGFLAVALDERICVHLIPHDFQWLTPRPFDALPMEYRFGGEVIIPTMPEAFHEHSSSSPSLKSPKPKRISYVKVGVLIVDQVKPAILNGTAVRFDLSKGKGIK
jgi:hypothetical protein